MFSVIRWTSLAGVLKMPCVYQELLKITHRWNHWIKNNRNKFFIMLKSNSVNVHWNTTTARSAKVRTGWPYIGDFGNFFNGLAESLRVLRSIALNIEWVHFELKNCEIQHSVRCLYDKNSASQYCFTLDVMFKWYKRLVYTHTDLLARFCKVNLWNAKYSAWCFFSGLINLRWSRAIMAVKCDRRWLLFWGGTWGYLGLSWAILGCLQIIFL